MSCIHVSKVSRILSRKTDRIAGGGRRHRLRLEQGVSLTVTIAYRTANYRQLSPRVAHHRPPKTATRAFVRPHCVPNPKIAEIHLLRHCRDRDVMFGRRDMEHKATEVYRYYRSLRDSLSDSRLKSLKSFRSILPCLSLCIDSATRPVPTSATFSYVPDSTFDAGPSLPINLSIATFGHDRQS